MFKKIIIYGLGLSGISVIKNLSKFDYEIIATDDDEKIVEKYRYEFEKYDKNYIKFVKNSEIEKFVTKNDAIVFAPGIALYYPTRHKILEIVEKTNCYLTCDIELFYLLNQNKNYYYIAITGTNGKSTVVSLIDFILKNLKLNSHLVGNIGKPIFDIFAENDDEDKTLIVENSSFQLDLVKKIKYNIAAISNIGLDHIDRHGNFENYYQAKKKIFINQNQGDYAILNYDDDNYERIKKELLISNKDLKIISFSIKNKIQGGVFIKDEKLFNNFDKELSFDLTKRILQGEHNLENIALAFSSVYCFLKDKNLNCDEIMQQKIIDIICQYQGLKHRMQYLGQIDDINFINDSKATNAESTEKSLKSYDNIFWIVGGKSKEGGIESLKPYFHKIIKAYLIGESSDEFAKFFKKNDVNYEKVVKLENAFLKSYEDAKNNNAKNKNIILSPACSSYDQWKNFEERGDYFCNLFNELKKE